MGKNGYGKNHRSVPGAEIGIRIDQTLMQDATGERLQKERYA